jgi:hypothetical protein
VSKRQNGAAGNSFRFSFIAKLLIEMRSTLHPQPVSAFISRFNGSGLISCAAPVSTRLERYPFHGDGCVQTATGTSGKASFLCAPQKKCLVRRPFETLLGKANYKSIKLAINRRRTMIFICAGAPL